MFEDVSTSGEKILRLGLRQNSRRKPLGMLVDRLVLEFCLAMTQRAP